MNRQEYMNLNFGQLAAQCDEKATDNAYWGKCRDFVHGLVYKSWSELSYKQVNWLQNIIEEV